MGWTRRQTPPDPIERPDQDIARAVLAAVAGPPPTPEGTRILAARGQVKIAAKLGEAVDQRTRDLAARPLPEGG